MYNNFRALLTLPIEKQQLQLFQRIHIPILLKKNFFFLIAGWIPVRAIIGLMMFTACWTSYMCRLQMPILAVPMIATCGEDHEHTIGNNYAVNVTVRPIEQNSRVNVDEKEQVRQIWQDSDTLMHDIVKEEWDRRVKRTTSTDKEDKRDMFDLFSGKPFHWEPWLRGMCST